MLSFLFVRRQVRRECSSNNGSFLRASLSLFYFLRVRCRSGFSAQGDLSISEPEGRPWSFHIPAYYIHTYAATRPQRSGHAAANAAACCGARVVVGRRASRAGAAAARAVAVGSSTGFSGSAVILAHHDAGSGTQPSSGRRPVRAVVQGSAPRPRGCAPPRSRA